MLKIKASAMYYFITIWVIISLVINYSPYLKKENYITISYKIQTDHDIDLQLFYTTNQNLSSEFNEEESLHYLVNADESNYSNVIFNLPVKKIDKVRFDFGDRSGNVLVKKVEVEKGDYKEDITQKLEYFNLSGVEMIQRGREADIYLEIISTGEDPFAFSDFSFGDAITDSSLNYLNLAKLTVMLLFVLCIKKIYIALNNLPFMKPQLITLAKYIPLLRELVIRDIKIRYRRSFLGLIWTLLNPLLMMAIISFVFSNFFKMNIENFPVYLLCGQVIFNFFSESTTGAMTSIIGNAPLIKKIYIPKYLFTISKVISTMVNLFASIIALIVVMIITGMKIEMTVMLFYLPIIYVVVFSTGIGMLLSTSAVFFRDILHLYGVLLTAWTYLTPIFYPVDILPAFARAIVELNPITSFITYFRTLMIYGQIPTYSLNISCFVWSFGIFLLGIVVFYRKQTKFILYI